MKVLFVLPFAYGTPGTNASYYYARYLSKLGCSVVVVSHGGIYGGGEEDNTQITFYHVGELSRLRRLVFISKLISAERPDVVHVIFRRGSFFLPLIYKTKTFFCSSTRWILDVRSPLISAGYRRIFGRAMGFFEQCGYDFIAGPCVHSIEDVIPLRYKPTTIFPIGVESIAVVDNIFIDLPNPVRAVYIGSLSKHRKLDQLLQAIQISQRSLATNGIQLFVDIFGSNSESLQSEVERLGLGGIAFRGHLARDYVSSTLRKYHIGLAYIPSEIYANSPSLKTLEYMAAGLCVVATNTVGNRMFIRDQSNGILAECAPLEYGNALASAVLSGSNQDIREQATEDAKRWSWEAIVRNIILPTYSSLLQARKARE